MSPETPTLSVYVISTSFIGLAHLMVSAGMCLTSRTITAGLKKQVTGKTEFAKAFLRRGVRSTVSFHTRHLSLRNFVIAVSLII